MMTRTLRPRNTLQKKEPFSFDETPSRERRRRSTGKKADKLQDEKVPTGEGKGGPRLNARINASSNELQSSELPNEQNKIHDETGEKRRPRGRPRGRPTKYENSKVANAIPTGTECNDISNSQDTLKNTFERNQRPVDLSASVFGRRNLRKKNVEKGRLEMSADVNDYDHEVASSIKATSRKLTNSRKRKRQDDYEMVDDDFVQTSKMTSKRLKGRRKMTAGRAESLGDPTGNQASRIGHNKTDPTSDSLSDKTSEKDYQEFQEVITIAETELQQNKIAFCPFCKKTKSKSLPNLLHHMRYFCPSYIKGSGSSYSCSLCNRKCRSSATLDKHIKTVHSENNPLQSKSPEQLTRLEFNKLRKQQGGKVKCPNPQCKKTFTTVEGVKYHVPRCGVDIKPTLKCEYCGKAYGSKPGLNAHIITRHTQTKFVQVSSSKEEVDPTGKRGAAAKAIKKLHQIAVDGEIQDSSGGDNEFLSEMSSCRMVKALFRCPTKYKPTATDLASWKVQIETKGNAACMFCKKLFAAVTNLKAHINSCKLRPGRQPFYCLSCQAEFTSNGQVLKHLRDFHRELVIATLEKARKDEEDKWEAIDEYEVDEEDDEALDLEEEEVEVEGEEEEGNVDEAKKKRFRNRFDGTRLDDSFRHVVQQVMQASDWTRRFRAKNYCLKCTTLFPDWKVDISKWNALSESASAPYHPRTKESATFVIEKRKGRLVKKKTETIRLPLYGAVPVEKEEEQVTFFVGGPVWAMSWCPVPDNAPLAHSYVALSCYLEMDHTQFYDQLEPAPSLIQIWDLGVLKLGTSTTPQMVLGIAHDFGITNGIQWCPSGGYQPFEDVPDSQESSRLGLLAVACSAGCATIYSVPHPKKEQTIYKPDPVVTLKPTRLNEWFGQCLCLDWSQNKGHSRIVGGFGNGAVTIWNLHTTSSLLADDMNGCLYPTQVLYACTSFVIAVSLNPKDDNFLLVSSIDRSTSMWDVRFPSCPMDEINFSTGLDCHWPLHYPLGMVSTESHSQNSRGCVVHLFDTGQYNNYFTEMVLHSSVWSFSISDWLHCIAGGCDDGRVGINMYFIPGTKYKSAARLKQRIVTEICMEVKPSQPTNNQETLSSTGSKEKVNNMTENCAQEVEASYPCDQGSKIEAACSGSRSNKEGTAVQELAEKVKGHGHVELLNDLGSKSSNQVVQDGSVGEEMRRIEISNQSDSSLAISGLKEGNRIISQDTCLGRTGAQDHDSQNVTENEILPVYFIGSNTQSEDEADSVKLQENDLSEKRFLNEGNGESLGDVVNGVRSESIGSSGDVQMVSEESLNPKISGNLSDCGERDCSKSIDGEGEVRGITLSVTMGKQFIDNKIYDDEKKLDGMKSGDVIETEDGEDQKLGPMGNGVLDLSALSQKDSCGSNEVDMAITAKEDNLNSFKQENESCEMLDESDLNESRIESLDSQINELMSTCHSTLEDLKKCSTLSTEDAVKPLSEDEKASPKKRKLKKKKREREVKLPEEKKLCIMDEAFDIRQVFGDCDLTGKDDNDSKTMEDKDVLRDKVKAWRPKYEETEATKFVLYKDYFEPSYASPTWTPLSKKLLSRTPEMNKTHCTDFLLNAVNKVAWSPNYHSCRWLLMAGNNGIVRVVHISCLEPLHKMKKF